MVKMMHIAELKLDEQNKNINTKNKGVMENRRRDEGRKAYGGGQEKNTPLEKLSTLTR